MPPVPQCVVLAMLVWWEQQKGVSIFRNWFDEGIESRTELEGVFHFFWLSDSLFIRRLDTLDRGENVIELSQKQSEKQRICNNPELFNSSEDEELQQELSSILTNGHQETETQSLHRPRFLVNPMKFNPSYKIFPNDDKSHNSNSLQSHQEGNLKQLCDNDSRKVSNYDSNQIIGLNSGEEHSKVSVVQVWTN